MNLKGKTIVLGITGGIAAYKSCNIVRLLQKRGARVKVVMSEHATEFVGPLTFRALTNEPVAVGLFDDPSDPIHHISLAQEPDLVVVAPATANIIAKMANGIADDLISTTLLATPRPIVIAPAMNNGMWKAPATQANMATLRDRGVHVVGPGSGYLACGDVDTGRMSEPEDIVEAICEVLNPVPQDLAGKRIVITAGPTHEPIDPVRFIGNRSSGKMGIALAKLAEEDPTFRTYTDEETGQTIIAGMGELHLEIIVDRLLREFKVEANVGAPQVAYKETVKGKADVDMKYARQSGGKGQYGHVKIKLEPNESGKGYEFINAIVGGAIPKEYIPAVDAGIQGAMQAGVLAGYPVVDVKVTLYDGSYHEVDSSEMAFKIAGSMAFKEAMRKADPVILEPIMKVCVIVPEEYMGDVIGDLNSRRGQIRGFEDRPGAKQIDAFVPLSEMFGYATDLRSKTQGRGQYTMEPSHYIELPKNIAEKLVTSRTKAE